MQVRKQVNRQSLELRGRTEEPSCGRVLFPNTQSNAEQEESPKTRKLKRLREVLKEKERENKYLKQHHMKENGPALGAYFPLHVVEWCEVRKDRRNKRHLHNVELCGSLMLRIYCKLKRSWPKLVQSVNP
jgi:hypothetical protein